MDWFQRQPFQTFQETHISHNVDHCRNNHIESEKRQDTIKCRINTRREYASGYEEYDVVGNPGGVGALEGGSVVLW